MELTIDTDDKDKNQAYFEALVKDHSAIETKLDFKLNWEPLEQRRSCRIGVEVPGAISDTEDTLSVLVGWAASTTIKFVNVMRPYIDKLPSES